MGHARSGCLALFGLLGTAVPGQEPAIRRDAERWE